jgi:hypothetical protein
MPIATGPWCHPPELPQNGRTLCLVLIEDRKGNRSYQIMRYLRNNWQFQEGLGMGNHRVVAWAAINMDSGEPVRTNVAAGNAATVLGAFLDEETMKKLKALDQ